MLAQASNETVKDSQDRSLIGSLEDRKLSLKAIWSVDVKTNVEFVDELVVSLVDDSDLETISHFARLCVLSCTGTFSNQGVGKLLKLSRLTQLTAFSPFLSTDSVQLIGKMTSLRRLDIRMKTKHGFDLQPLSNLSNLESLKLPASQHIGDAEIAKISNLKRLVLLDVSDCAISDAGIDALLKLERLKWLKIAGNPITSDGVAKFIRLENLKFLHLDGISVNDNTIETLVNANGCKLLIIPYAMTQDDGHIALGQKINSTTETKLASLWSRNENGKIRLSNPTSKINGRAKANRNLVGDLMQDRLKDDRVDRLYIASTEDQLAVSIVLKNEGGAVDLSRPLIPVLYSLLLESDVASCKLDFRHGDEWIENKFKPGPIVFSALIAIAEEPRMSCE